MTACTCADLRTLLPDHAMEWAQYGGDPGGTKYSPISDIDRTRVSTLGRADDLPPHVFDADGHD
jgi:glucose dehydrogenase